MRRIFLFAQLHVEVGSPRFQLYSQLLPFSVTVRPPDWSSRAHLAWWGDLAHEQVQKCVSHPLTVALRCLHYNTVLDHEMC